jgi:hypothetical protein
MITGYLFSHVREVIFRARWQNFYTTVKLVTVLK